MNTFCTNCNDILTNDSNNDDLCIDCCDLIFAGITYKAEKSKKPYIHKPFYNESIYNNTCEGLARAIKGQKKYRDKYGFGYNPYDADVSAILERKQAMDMCKQ